ncbi:HNH endonuclease [Actinomadura sp. LOL_016]|uniref:HNH endonuclease n=1 Tax=unclassified Actinomadura TaxID=2626254 RepID=UPI003A807CF6
MSTLVSEEFDRRLRSTAMAWLDRRITPENPVVTRAELQNFHFEGQRISLADRGRGIRKPEGFTAAISILTSYKRRGKPAPYNDTMGPDGFLRYKHQSNPQDHTNKALREALRRQLPLIWFFGVNEGVFHPIYPVWVVADEPEHSQVAVALNAEQLELSESAHLSPAEKHYSERVSKARLHQPVFRQRVLLAYNSRCAICRLQHPSLLDAAHILPDREERSLPEVSNGLALCKIHHAAYDANILGIRSDLVVHIRADILQEIDGPMLKHGLQEMHNVPLTTPHASINKPNRDFISERYERFLAAK